MNRDLQFSRIQDHNRYQRTDQLYDPLRKVLLTPGEIEQHRQLIPDAAYRSHVGHDYAYLGPQQIHELRDHTYIPINKQLKATHDLSKVQGKQFMVVDANRRVTGQPINEEQMNRIRAGGLREEKVLYDFGRPQPIRSSGPYRPPHLQNFETRDKYKYNLYSMIDQPANLIKEKGCGACTCPGNQIIASRNEPQSLGWFK